MGPNMQFPIRSVIPEGRSVFVHICQRNWCCIKYNAETGWISSRYLSFRDGVALYHAYTMFSNTDCDYRLYP
ncbi:SH3 domain-containing protein [Bartonella sp. CB178]|uniref:SH3 domain-containing protein n=1 Tax=Bartonella sp. CB178 TaxID=3112255 RepID=UPI00300DF343